MSLFPSCSSSSSSSVPTPESTCCTSRRGWMLKTLGLALVATTCCSASTTRPALAAEADDDASSYDNPNIPPGPEERSGLVVLRVAEVCQFQEKILRAVVRGDVDAVVSPQQIVFGTQILLRNSNLAGNMKLMIDTEVPHFKRTEAIGNAVTTMNTLQSIASTAAKIQRPFTDEEMLGLADMYRTARLQLNAMYEYLPQKGKDKYYGYFMAVTEYEKKVAEGVYNPDIDGVLKFDD